MLKKILVISTALLPIHLHAMNVQPDWQLGVQKNTFKWCLTPPQDSKYYHHFIPAKNEHSVSSVLHWKVNLEKTGLTTDTTNYILSLYNQLTQSDENPKITKALSNRLQLGYEDYYYLSNQEKRTLLYLVTDAYYKDEKIVLAKGDSQFSLEMHRRITQLPKPLKTKI